MKNLENFQALGVPTSNPLFDFTEKVGLKIGKMQWTTFKQCSSALIWFETVRVEVGTSCWSYCWFKDEVHFFYKNQ